MHDSLYCIFLTTQNIIEIHYYDMQIRTKENGVKIVSLSVECV